MRILNCTDCTALVVLEHSNRRNPRLNAKESLKAKPTTVPCGMMTSSWEPAVRCHVVQGRRFRNARGVAGTRLLTAAAIVIFTAVPCQPFQHPQPNPVLAARGRIHSVACPHIRFGQGIFSLRMLGGSEARENALQIVGGRGEAAEAVFDTVTGYGDMTGVVKVWKLHS